MKKKTEIGYKEKFIILLLSLAVVCVLLWKYSISYTLELISETNYMAGNFYESDQLDEKILSLSQSLGGLEKQLGSTDINTFEIKQRLLEQTIEFCEKQELELINLPQTHDFKNGQYNLVTNTFIVSGKYKDLTEFCYYLENDSKLSRVISVNYYINKDKATKREKLYAKFYLQNITKS